MSNTSAKFSDLPSEYTAYLKIAHETRELFKQVQENRRILAGMKPDVLHTMEARGDKSLVISPPSELEPEFGTVGRFRLSNEKVFQSLSKNSLIQGLIKVFKVAYNDTMSEKEIATNCVNIGNTIWQDRDFTVVTKLTRDYSEDAKAAAQKRKRRKDEAEAEQNLAKKSA